MITLQDIEQSFVQSLSTGNASREGILEGIVNFFVATFSDGIVKLMVMIIPIIVLVKILDILLEYIRNPSRSVKTLVMTSLQTILHYTIIIFLAEFWVKYFYQDMFEIVTKRLPMQLLNLSEPLSLDRITRIFTAPFIVFGNILSNNSQKLVEMIYSGASQEEINREIYSKDYWDIITESVKAVVSVLATGLSFITDALKSLLGVKETGNFLVKGFAFVGVWLIGIKIMKLFSTILFAYLFAGLSVAVSLAMGTFHFIFTSEKIQGLSGGMDKLLRIILNSIAKFTVLIAFLFVANNPDIPLSPIWTATKIAKIQDDDKFFKNFNEPQTFYLVLGYWLFMILFTKVFQETTDRISII